MRRERKTVEKARKSQAFSARDVVVFGLEWGEESWVGLRRDARRCWRRVLRVLRDWGSSILVLTARGDGNGSEERTKRVLISGC